MPLNNIMGLFAYSPLTPLHKHAAKVSECCDLLVPFFDAAFAADWQKAQQLRNQIAETEGQADSLKREIRLNLPRGLMMPFDRTDLLDLVTAQDKLANIARDIAGRTLGRELSFPNDMKKDFMEMLTYGLDAIKQSNKAIDDMEQLLAGGKSREVSFIKNMIHELDVLEDHSDHVQVRVRTALRNVESQYNAVDVVFMYKIIDWVGVLADQAQRVGSRIELMLARN